MPHVIVKLWPGPTEQQKAKLADRIVKDLVASIDTADESVSVDIEEASSTAFDRYRSTSLKIQGVLLW